MIDYIEYIVNKLFGKRVILDRQKFLFIIVGMCNTIFGYSVFALLIYFFSSRISYQLILVLSYPIAITNAYILHKLFVFKTKGNILKEYLRFSVTYFVVFVINFFVLPLLVEFLYFNIYVAQGLILIVNVIFSFVMHKNYTFKKVVK